MRSGCWSLRLHDISVEGIPQFQKQANIILSVKNNPSSICTCDCLRPSH